MLSTNHQAVIKRLFHHQTGNLRQSKKTNYETIKDHNFQNEYQLRRPSISVLMYTFTTKKYSARDMRVCLLGILSPQCICFLIGWYEIVNTNSSLNFVNVDAKMPENNF